MENFEKIFHETPFSHRKYCKRLYQFISYLVDKGRLLEAKHYHSTLMKLKPDNIKNNILGYEISIKTFDKQAVVLYDKFLWEKSNDKYVIIKLQLQYYYSVGDIKNFCINLSMILKKDKLSLEELNNIIGLAFTIEYYAPISILYDYFKIKKIAIKKEAEGNIKQITLQQLAETIVKVKK